MHPRHRTIALTDPSTTPRPALRRTFLGFAGTGDAAVSCELLAGPDGTLSLGAESSGDRLRFRLVLDSGLAPRLMLEMPPRRLDAAGRAAVAAALSGFLNGSSGGTVLALLVCDAATREIALLDDSNHAAARLASLRMLRADLAAWRAMPAGARQAAPAFLGRNGSAAPVSDPPDALPGRIARVEAAVDAVMSGDAKPHGCRSDPGLSSLQAAVERARLRGVRSTLYVAVGIDPAAAPRVAGIQAALDMAAFEELVLAKRVDALDLVVTYCAAPGDANLAVLLRLLSRNNTAPRIVLFDAEDVLVSGARALSRALGIPVAA